MNTVVSGELRGGMPVASAAQLPRNGSGVTVVVVAVELASGRTATTST